MLGLFSRSAWLACRLSVAAKRRAYGTLSVIVAAGAISGTFAALMGLADGMSQMFKNSGRADRAIVLSQGVKWEGFSALSREAAARIGAADTILAGRDGMRLVATEFVTGTYMEERATGLPIYISIRGTSGPWRTVRPEIELVEGRVFSTGQYELIAGKRLDERVKGASIGDVVDVEGTKWKVVGNFESNTVHDSAMFADAHVLMDAVGRNMYSSMLAVLESEGAVAAFDQRLSSQQATPAHAVNEAGYYQGFDQGLPQLRLLVMLVTAGVGILGLTVGVLAFLSGMETRLRDFAILKCLGFERRDLSTSILLEAVALGVLGALIGASVSFFLFQGVGYTFGADSHMAFIVQLRIRDVHAASAVALGAALIVVAAIGPGLRAGNAQPTLATGTRDA